MEPGAASCIANTLTITPTTRPKQTGRTPANSIQPATRPVARLVKRWTSTSPRLPWTNSTHSPEETLAELRTRPQLCVFALTLMCLRRNERYVALGAAARRRGSRHPSQIPGRALEFSESRHKLHGVIAFDGVALCPSEFVLVDSGRYLRHGAQRVVAAVQHIRC